jgi:hypothetical protein
VAASREFAVVLGHRLFITGGDLGRVGVADGAAAVFIELAAQLQFQRIHFADQLLVHLLDQGGIPGEAAGVQLAHLINQSLQLLPRIGAILHCGANLIEKIHSLVDLALRIGGVGTSLRRHRPSRDASIAGVNAADYIAIAAGPTGRIADLAGKAIANLTGLASAGLTTLTRLARLPGLAAAELALTVAAKLALAVTALLAFVGTALLAWAGLRIRLASAEAGELVAQTG